ncbi:MULTISPECIES: hypothetical protein [Vibrio]|uniref:hypothetical protein n=1 Tax=Vibrio TaxID=662 RepID=UPI00187FE65A|nr:MULTISPECIES: hypothetical protein [Vibrio]MCF7354228.1 hypothetical protein [Vibrio sp. CK2-1]
MKIFYTAIMLISVTSFCDAKELYREPTARDSGTYYVLTHEKMEPNVSKVLTNRIGKGNEYTSFTELKINCASKQYFELAGSIEDGVQEKPTKPLKDWSSKSKWTSLVSGSSKYDLVQFVCKKNKA